MSLGFVLILIGTEVLMRSLTPYAIVLAFAVLIDRKSIAVEERMLVETFGADRAGYRESTRRWV